MRDVSQLRREMKVHIVSRKLVKPSTPTPHHLRSFKTSSIDQLAPQAYVPIFLYYNASNGDEIDGKRKRLEKSLSEILTLYYPLAGRYINDNKVVNCNDEGVEYLEAQVSGQLAQLLQEEVIKLELLNNLAPFAMVSANTPLAIVQVNMFECGGLVIGFLFSHIIADGIAATTFLNAWATTCCIAGINGVIRPSLDLASFFPPKENIAVVRPKNLGALIITRRFMFNGAAITSLKAIAKDGACDSKSLTKQQHSRVMVVTALIWKALIAVEQAKHGHLRPSILCHSLSLRGRTALPIPENSFGNLYMMAKARFGGKRGDSESKMELHELVGLLDDSLRNVLADCKKPQRGDDLVSMITNSSREISEELERGETDVFIFSSWCRFPLYEVDFGWGKPIWVSNRPKPVEIVNLMDTKDGDVIEAWVHLNEKDMLLFQTHPDITAFTSHQI